MKPPAVDPAGIPDALKALPQWVVWKYVRRDGRRTKVPFNAAGGEAASTTDRATWATFADAWAAYRRGGYAGVGFVFAADDPLFGGDLDGCLDDAGALSDAARAILDAADTYSERTPSGRGVHFIGYGRLPEDGRRDDAIGFELYQAGRFFTVTGHRLEDRPAEPQMRIVEAAQLYERHFKKPAPPPPPPREPQPIGDVDDAELIDRMCRGNAGAAALWRGDVSAYPSKLHPEGDRSSADSALVFHLTYWTRGDAGRVDRLFRQSALYRDKWERADYRERTIAGALALVDSRPHVAPAHVGTNGNGNGHQPEAPEASALLAAENAYLRARLAEAEHAIDQADAMMARPDWKDSRKVNAWAAARVLSRPPADSAIPPAVAAQLVDRGHAPEEVAGAVEINLGLLAHNAGNRAVEGGKLRADTMGADLADFAAGGAIAKIVEDVFDPETRKKCGNVMYLSRLGRTRGQLLAAMQAAPLSPERRRAEPKRREGKRCKACGSENLAHVCLNCGTYQDEDDPPTPPYTKSTYRGSEAESADTPSVDTVLVADSGVEGVERPPPAPDPAFLDHCASCDAAPATYYHRATRGYYCLAHAPYDAEAP